MKIGKKKKKIRNREDDEPRNKHTDSESDGAPSWAIQGREEIHRAQKRSEAEAKSGRRPPELWVLSDDSTIMRFLRNEPIAAIFRYRLQVNGKWTAVTAPGPGEPDRMKRAGLRPQLVHVYPAIDVNGYVDKKTKKRMKNLPRYLAVPGRVEKTISRIREKVGDLTKYPFEYCRMGSGTDTVYTFLREDKAPMPAEFIEAGKKLRKEFAQYYAPPTEEQQRILLSGVTQEEDETDDKPVRSKKRFNEDDED